jgi:hypothetical protein
VYQDGGRVDDAIAIYEPLVADLERILGAEHADTLGSLRNLASAYEVAGRTADAERVRGRLGEDDPEPSASGWDG